MKVYQINWWSENERDIDPDSGASLEQERAQEMCVLGPGWGVFSISSILY